MQQKFDRAAEDLGNSIHFEHVNVQVPDGYRVGPGFTGVLAIFGPPGTLGMTLEEALTARVLRPVFDTKIASTTDE